MARTNVKNLAYITRALKNYGEAVKTDIQGILMKNGAQMQLDAENNKPAQANITIDQATPSDSGMTVTVAAHQNGNGDWAIYWEVGTGKSYLELAPSLTPEMRAIALTAYKNGKGTITPHPYMFPAFLKARRNTIADIKKAIKRRQL